MSAPELDRIATKGYYGDAVTRFVSIITRGWYDIALAVNPAYAASLTEINGVRAMLSEVRSRTAALSEIDGRTATLTQK